MSTGTLTGTEPHALDQPIRLPPWRTASAVPRSSTFVRDGQAFEDRNRARDSAGSGSARPASQATGAGVAISATSTPTNADQDIGRRRPTTRSAPPASAHEREQQREPSPRREPTASQALVAPPARSGRLQLNGRMNGPASAEGPPLPRVFASFLCPWTHRGSGEATLRFALPSRARRPLEPRESLPAGVPRFPS